MEHFKDQMAVCVGVYLVSMIVSIAGLMFQGVIMGLQLGGVDSFVVIGFTVVVTYIGLLIFNLWISSGLLLFFMNVAGGRNAGFGDLFSAGRYLLPYIVSTIIYAIVSLCLGGIAFGVPSLLAYLLGGGDQTALVAGIGIGSLAAFVVVLMIAIRLSQYQFLIFDNKAGAIDSLAMSVELTRGKSLQLLGMILLAIPINLLGVLACCVGTLFTMPFTILMWAVTYFALTGQPVADPTAPYRHAGPKPLAPDDLL